MKKKRIPYYDRPKNYPWQKGFKMGPKIDFEDQIAWAKINIKRDGQQKSKFIGKTLRPKRHPSSDTHYICKD